MAKRSSRGKKTGGGRRGRRGGSRSGGRGSSARGGRSRKQASMIGPSDGVTAPAREEVRQAERDFETA